MHCILLYTILLQSIPNPNFELSKVVLEHKEWKFYTVKEASLPVVAGLSPETSHKCSNRIEPPPWI